MRSFLLFLLLIAVMCACVLGVLLLLREPGQAAPEVLLEAGDALSETVSVAREAKDGLAMLAAALGSDPKPRMWTHVDGRTVEAVMTAANANEVTFQRSSDGRVFTVGLESLSRSDRIYVRTWLDRNAK